MGILKWTSKFVIQLIMEVLCWPGPIYFLTKDYEFGMVPEEVSSSFPWEQTGWNTRDGSLVGPHSPQGKEVITEWNPLAVAVLFLVSLQPLLSSPFKWFSSSCKEIELQKSPGVPMVAQQKWTLTNIHEDAVSIPVWSLALLSGLRIQCCCELWCRSQTWLWSSIVLAVCRPATVATVATATPIQPLAWELPYAAGAALRRKKKGYLHCCAKITTIHLQNAFIFSNWKFMNIT